MTNHWVFVKGNLGQGREKCKDSYVTATTALTTSDIAFFGTSGTELDPRQYQIRCSNVGHHVGIMLDECHLTTEDMSGMLLYSFVHPNGILNSVTP
ncbi:hypothetical protein Tco_0978644 [Tanacetum coccineum]|uniref:Uncharacterized protein n=1 Tax=Tanacetum coccineum TaxID=301880 RepID=A0ABQ5ENS1_9ASTR